MAVDQSLDVARELNVDTTADSIDELGDLIELSRNKSEKGRSALLAALHDLYSNDDQLLTEQDRVIMTEIMQELVHKVEMSVRRSLAERLAKRTDAPHALIVRLANDEIDVAYPILVESSVLHDIELIEVVQQRTMEHQLAIAIRPQISEQVSDALVNTDNEKVICTLLSNENARISSNAINGLIEKSREIESFRKPLVCRQDLPQDLAKKLYWGVSAALRKHIVENYEIDRSELDEAIEVAVNDVLEKENAAARGLEARLELTDSVGREPEHVLIQLLRQGHVEMFLNKFTSMTGLRVTLARRFLFEEGGEGLAVACKSIGLDKYTFVTIFLCFRQGRIGDKQVESDELMRAATFYDKIERAAAQSLLSRWNRDPDYLNAMRLIDNTN